MPKVPKLINASNEAKGSDNRKKLKPVKHCRPQPSGNWPAASCQPQTVKGGSVRNGSRSVRGNLETSGPYEQIQRKSRTDGMDGQTDGPPENRQEIDPILIPRAMNPMDRASNYKFFPDYSRGLPQDSQSFPVLSFGGSLVFAVVS